MAIDASLLVLGELVTHRVTPKCEPRQLSSGVHFAIHPCIDTNEPMSSLSIANIQGSEDLSVKRARSTQTTDSKPALPKLTSEIILEVFTHSSLPRGNKRLVELGKAASHAAVTHVLFTKRPLLTPLEIEANFISYFPNSWD
jgi:hypothetical protein